MNQSRLFRCFKKCALAIAALIALCLLRSTYVAAGGHPSLTDRELIIAMPIMLCVLLASLLSDARSEAPGQED